MVTVHLRVIRAAPPCFTLLKRARFTPMYTKAALETEDSSFTHKQSSVLVWYQQGCRCWA